jgi:uncharacterized protein YndB with AHSA1/START domain
MNEALVSEVTGRESEQWFAMLDQWEATGRSHTEIARWLQDEQGIAHWWAQSITVAYERARGLRAPGQRPDGFLVTSSKTVAVPVERLFDAFADEGRRERWLPGVQLRVRTAKAPHSARYDWPDGSTRIAIGFTELGERKSRVALAHERLPDAETADAMKAWWRERMAALKRLFE